MIDIEQEIKNKDFLIILLIVLVFAVFVGALNFFFIFSADNIDTVHQSYFVTQVSGAAFLKRDGQKIKEIEKHMFLRQNDAIKTKENSFVEVKLGDGDLIRLKGNSQLKLDSKINQRPTRLHLLYGEILSKITFFRRKTEIFKIETKTFTVGVRGTSFLLDYRPPETLLYVKEGVVEFTTPRIEDSPIKIKEGSKLELSGNQVPEIKALHPDDQIKLDEFDEMDTRIKGFEQSLILFSKMQDDIRRGLKAKYKNIRNSVIGKSKEEEKEEESAKIEEKTGVENQYRLKISVIPVQAGAVNIDGKKCAMNCSFQFGGGEVARLTAIPADFAVFGGWYTASGSLIGKSEILEVAMNSNKQIQALFEVDTR